MQFTGAPPGGGADPIGELLGTPEGLLTIGLIIVVVVVVIIAVVLWLKKRKQ
ncbi:MAG: hypothetical protein RTV72_07490 [Candidatus Thorarchaeota archaeon]